MISVLRRLGRWLTATRFALGQLPACYRMNYWAVMGDEPEDPA